MSEIDTTITDEEESLQPADDSDQIDASDLGNEDDDEEAALWAELEREEQASGPVDTSPSADDADGEGDEEKVDPEAQSAATREEGSDDASSSDDGTSGDRQPDDQNAQDDIWANASPAQKAAFEAASSENQRLKQSDRSQKGRISVLQRLVDEARNGQAAHVAASGNAGTDSPKPGDYFESDEWKTAEEEYPEVLAPVRALFDAMQNRLSNLEGNLSVLSEQQVEEALDAQEALLLEQHPDWLKVMSDTAKVNDWLEDQPRHVREAARRNKDAIYDAAEAADIVSRYKRFLAGESEGPPDSGTDTPGKDNKSSGKRKRQLESAASTRTRGPGAATGVIPEDGDEEAIWKAFDKLEERQAARG